MNSFQTAALLLTLLSASLSQLSCTAAKTENPILNRLQGKTCQVWSDEQGIPHARFQGEPGENSALGTLACFGYLHGRERAWQMDYFRRTAQGRKAEVLGKA